MITEWQAMQHRQQQGLALGFKIVLALKTVIVSLLHNTALPVHNTTSSGPHKLSFSSAGFGTDHRSRQEFLMLVLTCGLGEGSNGGGRVRVELHLLVAAHGVRLRAQEEGWVNSHVDLNGGSNKGSVTSSG